MNPQIPDESGSYLNSRYELLGLLGRGGMSEVYRAYDVEEGRVVALKRVRTPCGKQAAAIRREAEVLEAIRHSGVVRVWDSGETEEGPWLSLEYVPGWDVEAVVRGRQFEARDFMRVAAQALQALQAVHAAGYFHGDLKPGNVMLECTKGTWRVKLVDFGLSGAGVEGGMASSGPSKDECGSIHFVAPERFSGQGASVAGDLYALGAVFYFLLTGRYAVDGDSEIEIMAGHVLGRIQPIGELADLDRGVAEWVMRLMATEPGDRPASAVAAVRELAAAAARHNIDSVAASVMP